MPKNITVNKNSRTENTQGSYRQIMKATSIFGGVQVFNILISILRSKIIAVWLGPAGIGILGLFNATVLLISSLTNFGLGISAVKDIATATKTENEAKVSKTVWLVKKLMWVTGIFGALATLFLSPWLSEIAFGDDTYTISFIWLSLTVLLKQLASGELVILQGLRKLKKLANANLAGSLLGLVFSVPIYYYLRLEGIVPALVVTAVCTYLAALFYSKKIINEKVSVTNQELREDGKAMMVMGFMLSLSGIMVLGESYIIRIFINTIGGVTEVGLYNAGIALISTYVGLLFTAMETDYYPRLSEVAANNNKVKDLVNQQAEIGVLILAPVLIAFLVFVDWAIIILYSSEFTGVNLMVCWAFLGLFFKVPAWVIGFIFIAKGKGSLFFWSELAANVYLLVCNLIGYYYGGFSGLGISFLVAYVLYLMQVYLISKKKYNFGLARGFWRLFIVQFSLALLCFALVYFLPRVWGYSIGLVIILLSGWYSFNALDKRMNLKQIIKSYTRKK